MLSARAPQVGISSVWYEGNSCNMHLLELAEAVKEGVVAAGMVRTCLLHTCGALSCNRA